MSTLVAIDPGEFTGFAFFRDRRLEQAQLVRVTDANLQVGDLHPDELIIEIPRAYPGVRSQTDPNNLITLAVKAGRCIQAVGAKKTTKVFPSDWKGELTKEIVIGRVKARLSEAELAKASESIDQLPKTYQHNVWEAVGIGLYCLGRFGRW